MSVITDNCKILGVLEKATGLMSPAEIGEPIGMTALDAGRRLYWMLDRLVEKPDKDKALYRITQKGKDYLANPPKEPPGSVDEVDGKVGGKVDGKVGGKVGGKVDEVDGKVDEKSEEEKKEEEGLIPSQSDIFRSVAEQLSISKQKDGTPLSAIINYIQRTTVLNKASFRAVDQHNRQQPCFSHVSRGYQQRSQNHSLPAGVQPQRGSFQANSLHIAIEGASEASEPMVPAEVGERIGMPAKYAGQRLYLLRKQGRVEKPVNNRSAYRITEKGKGYLAKPPQEPPAKLNKSAAESAEKSAAESASVKIVEKTSDFIQEAETKKPLATPPETPPDKGKVVIPSQADIFRSIAEQLSISKAEEANGGTPLEGIINFVERTADLNDLNSLWNAGQAK